MLRASCAIFSRSNHSVAWCVSSAKVSAIAGIAPRVADRIATYARSPEFTGLVVGWIARLRVDVGDRALAGALTGERRAGLRRRLVEWATSLAEEEEIERMVAVILGGVFGRVPSVLCIMALFPMFTVLRRVLLAQRLLGAARESRLEATFDRVLPWRQPRYSPRYLLLCAALATAIVVLPWMDPFFYGTADPLGAWVRVP